MRKGRQKRETPCNDLIGAAGMVTKNATGEKIRDSEKRHLPLSAFTAYELWKLAQEGLERGESSLLAMAEIKAEARRRLGASLQQ